MNKDYDEIEIDLIALLWRMASHWKPILLTGFLCGVLFLGYSYHSDRVRYDKWQAKLMEEALEEDSDTKEPGENSQEMTETSDSDISTVSTQDLSTKTVQELIDERIKEREKAAADSEEATTYEIKDEPKEKEKELTEAQKEAVLTVVDKQLRYDKYADYVNNSPLMKLDCYNKNTLVVMYRLFPKSKKVLDESASLLVSSLLSEEAIDSFSKALEYGLDPRYIRELYSVTYTPVNSQISKNDFIHEGMIDLRMILTDDISGDLCKNALESTFEEIISRNDDINYEFEKAYNQITIDSDLLNKQNTFMSACRDQKSELKTAVNSFSDGQLEYYGTLLDDNNADRTFYEKEKAYRKELSDEVEKAKSAAEEAAVAAIEAGEAAEISAINAAKAEEDAELKAREAEEAAAEAARARAAQKAAKTKAAEALNQRSVSEASENAKYAEVESDNARRAALKAKSAAEVAAGLSEEAEAAAQSVDCAVELREKAKEAADTAAEASELADAKANDALLASQAAAEAVEIAKAAEEAAQAESASEEAILIAEEAKLAAEESDVTEDEEDEALEEEETVDPPSFSLSKLIIGIMLGLFLYGGIVFAFIILRPRVCPETSRELLSDRRTIWLREYREPKTLFERFINDVHIYRLRHRNLPAIGVQLEKAISSLDFFAKKDGFDSITLLSSDELKEKNALLQEMLMDKNADSKFKLDAMTISEDDPDYYNRIEELKDVILVSEYEISPLNRIYQTLCDLKEYGINCRGHLILGE